MDAAQSLHPTDQILSSYGLGKLDDRSAEAVNQHLEECHDCRKRVAEMSADGFLQRVRDAQKPSGHSTSGPSQDGGTQIDKGTSTWEWSSADSLPPGLADHPDYEIKRELGRGGMGVVYLAHNRLMGRDEVLKVMGQHLMEHPGVLERFLREIRSVAKLRHPNIVPAYHATRFGQSILFAMEYVEGLDLSKLVKTQGPMPVADACLFIHQAALGLQHAHEKGLVHRDIKPHNLMLSREGNQATVKILDFGLAKAAREEKVEGGLTATGQTLGTPDYIAPEQILNAPTADIRADIYSLGGTLYYLLTGHPPFQEKSLYDLYQAHISRDADPLNQVRPDVPAELAALVAKMMAKDPSQRFQTPGEMAQALTPFFKKVDSRDKAGSPESAPAVAPRRRPPWVWPAVAVGVFVVGLFAALVLRVKTPEGDLVFSNLPEQSVVTIDGKVYTVEWPGGKGPAKVTVPAGGHRVKVALNGVEVHGEEVSIEAGKERWITVRLGSRPASRLGRDEAPASPAELPKPAVTPRPTVVSPQLPKLVPGGGDSIITNTLGMKLALIPAGEFLMGSPDSDQESYDMEKPQHRVQITRPFYLGVHEVTQGQYRTVTGENPSHFKGSDDLPVEQVSWEVAIAFCNTLSEREGLKPYYELGTVSPLGGEGYRLPTEAEWEYACRAGSTTRYSFGNDAARLGEFAWYNSNSDSKTHPVGQRRPNAWGLHDMHGNVWEWCWDWYGPNYYGQSPGTNPVGPSQAADRVIRGGSWFYDPWLCRSAIRSGHAPEVQLYDWGFRVARVQSGR